MEKPIKLERNIESFEEFKNKVRPGKILDFYKELLEELFLIRNPHFKFNPNHKEEFEQFLTEHLVGESAEEAGEWFYFPWNGFLIHYLPDEMHQELRTARNKNLITKEEQEKFYNAVVGVAGLSVGSHPALTIAMMGGCKVMKLADPDVISGSNLNRIRFDFSKVGTKKLDAVVEQIYQINPYAEIYQYPDGITLENLDDFLSGHPKLDVLVEEMDNLEMKIRIRLEAKKSKIPVLMATDNGDNAIIDIERYDLDPDLEIFNGAAGHLTLEEFQKLQPQDMPKLSTKIAGPDLAVPKMQKSLLEVGRTLYSWPQLGDAATLAGASIAFLVRKIVNREKVKTGKIEINIDSIFDPDYFSEEEIQLREKQRKEFFKAIGLTE